MRSLDSVQASGYANGDWKSPWSVRFDDGATCFKLNGWGWVKTLVTYVMLMQSTRVSPANAEWRVFGTFYNDDRSILKTDNPSLQQAKSG